MRNRREASSTQRCQKHVRGLWLFGTSRNWNYLEYTSGYLESNLVSCKQLSMIMMTAFILDLLLLAFSFLSLACESDLMHVFALCKFKFSSCSITDKFGTIDIICTRTLFWTTALTHTELEPSWPRTETQAELGQIVTDAVRGACALRPKKKVICAHTRQRRDTLEQQGAQSWVMSHSAANPPPPILRWLTSLSPSKSPPWIEQGRSEDRGGGVYVSALPECESALFSSAPGDPPRRPPASLHPALWLSLSREGAWDWTRRRGTSQHRADPVKFGGGFLCFANIYSVIRQRLNGCCFNYRGREGWGELVPSLLILQGATGEQPHIK